MFANPFDILGDENEDSSNVPKPTQPKTAKAPAKPKDTKPAAPKPAASKPAANGAAAKPATSAAKPAVPKTEQKGDAQKPAAPKPQQAGGHQVAKGPAPVRDSNANLEEKNKEYHRGGADKRDRPRPPVAGAPGRDNKRVFDRKSGTGRSSTENKKGGEGKGNWGGEVDVREATEALKDEKNPADEEKEEEGKEGEKTEAEKKEAEEEKKEADKKAEERKKEIAQIGLDEYLKTLKAKAPKNVEAHKPRTVTSDDFESAGFVALKRDDDDDKKKKEKKKTEKKEGGEKKEAGEKKESLAEKLIRFPTYNDQRRDDRGPRENRGDRGDRRSPRPERFEGQGRNDRRPYQNAQSGSPAPAQANVAADYKSSKDFPTLAPHAAPAVADQPVKA